MSYLKQMAAPLENFIDFLSVTNWVSNDYSDDSHHHTATTTPRHCFNLKMGDIKYEKNEIMKTIATSIVSIFWFPGERIVESGGFLA